MDTVLEDFVMVVEVMSWDDSLDQAFGLLARVQPDPAPGAVNGYSLNYQPVNHNIELNRLVNEAPVNLLRVPLSLPPGEACRFVFIGRGDRLEAAVFTLAEPMKPLITLSVTDAAYTSGHGGLFAFDASDGGRVDVTFDSYEAGPPGVPPLEVALNAEGALEMVWPRLGAAWHLEESPDLAAWTDVLTGGHTSAGKLAWSTTPQGRNFYRLAAGFPSLTDVLPEILGLTTLDTQATASLTATHATGVACKALRVWTGELPGDEGDFILNVSFNDGAPVPIRLAKFESRIIVVPASGTVAFGSAESRQISVAPMGAAVYTESDTFPVSGSVNADRAGPPLWQPTAAHIVLPTDCAEFELPADTQDRIVFMAESADGTTWSPPRWLRTSSVGGVKVRATFQYIALANYEGAPIAVRGPPGSVIGGTSRTMHLQFPDSAGTTHSVSSVAEFKTAIGGAVAGDQIVLADGVYDLDINVNQASFTANHEVGGRRGMEGITIRGASGNRDACIISCKGSGVGDWSLIHQGSSALSGIRDITFDFSGSGTSGFLISRGAWSVENVRFTGSEGSKDGFNFVGPGIRLDMLRCQVDTAAADCINGNGGADGDLVRLIDCVAFGSGPAESNQALTSHGGLSYFAYGGRFYDSALNVIANVSGAMGHLYFTTTGRGNRRAGILGASAFACDLARPAETGGATMGAGPIFASVFSGTIRESTNSGRIIRGNLIRGGQNTDIGYYPSATTTLGFENNVLEGQNVGLRLDNGTGTVGTIRHNTIIGGGVGVSYAAGAINSVLVGNVTKETATRSISIDATRMALLTSRGNVWGLPSDADFLPGAGDIIGADAALDSRGYPIAGGNCDGTGDAAETEPLGGTDFNGAVLRLATSTRDRGALCRPRIIEGAELLPDIRF